MWAPDFPWSKLKMFPPPHRCFCHHVNSPSGPTEQPQTQTLKSLLFKLGCQTWSLSTWVPFVPSALLFFGYLSLLWAYKCRCGDVGGPARTEKKKLHLNSDCLGRKHWTVRLGVQLKNWNCCRSENLNCCTIIKLVRLWEVLMSKELRERQTRSRHTQCIPGMAAVPRGRNSASASSRCDFIIKVPLWPRCQFIFLCTPHFVLMITFL